jgi:diaminopimelate epimerase
MEFLKVHGAGNDFVFLDNRQGQFQPDPEVVALWCHRSFGIGADGILLFEGTVAQPRMLIYNSDGSRAAMCGNGIRCFVMELATRFGLEASPVRVETDSGPLDCAWGRDPDGVFRVTVDMGRARVDREGLRLGLLNLGVSTCHAGLTGIRVNTGNPHFVIFGQLSREERRTLGPLFAPRSPAFPDSVNAEFAWLRPDGVVELEVHERGAGFTLACGTGACATVAAAVERGLLAPGVEHRVELPGGVLFITVGADLSMKMRGPAEETYAGIVSKSLLEFSKKS